MITDVILFFWPEQSHINPVTGRWCTWADANRAETIRPSWASQAVGTQQSEHLHSICGAQQWAYCLAVTRYEQMSGGGGGGSPNETLLRAAFTREARARQSRVIPTHRAAWRSWWSFRAHTAAILRRWSWSCPGGGPNKQPLLAIRETSIKREQAFRRPPMRTRWGGREGGGRWGGASCNSCASAATSWGEEGNRLSGPDRDGGKSSRTSEGRVRRSTAHFTAERRVVRGAKTFGPLITLDCSLVFFVTRRDFS